MIVVFRRFEGLLDKRLGFFCVVIYSRIRSEEYKLEGGGFDFGFLIIGSVWRWSELFFEVVRFLLLEVCKYFEVGILY